MLNINLKFTKGSVVTVVDGESVKVDFNINGTFKNAGRLKTAVAKEIGTKDFLLVESECYENTYQISKEDFFKHATVKTPEVNNQSEPDTTIA